GGGVGAVVSPLGGALFAHQAAAGGRPWWRRGPALVVTESPSVLPTAVPEGEGVAAAFLRSRLLHGSWATRAAIRRALLRATAVHFSCHGTFCVPRPLAAATSLPSGETRRAVEWLGRRGYSLARVAWRAGR